MTFGELQTEFYARGFTWLNDGGAGQTRVKRWLNESYHELCEEDSWPFLETNTSGAAPLAIADLRQILDVYDATNEIQLLPIDRRQLRYYETDISTTGTSEVWYLENVTIKVFPVSTVTLTVRYLKVPVDLAASNDIPIIPVRYQDLIVDLAVIRAYRDRDNEARQILRQEADVAIAKMRDTLMLRAYDDAQNMLIATTYGL